MPGEPGRSERPAARGAVMVGLGIFVSRIAGLVRQRVFAHYFGSSDAADAFNAAFRIPNFLQNLFGEGVLSASFIPVYAGLRARGEDEPARRTAHTVGTILALATSLLVLAGVLATPLLIAAIAPGFAGAKRDLTIRLARILFPGAGLLVLSAWCLGILNSHRRFLLSYMAPVAWNAAMIATLAGWGGRLGEDPLALALAFGSVVGSALQFVVQLPSVMVLLRGLRPAIDLGSQHVRSVIRNFAPVFVSRGVVQISAYVDALLASLLPTGAVAGLGYAQVLYTLPVSLFGMSISAAELPEMSGATGSGDEIARELRRRLDVGLARIAFFVVPSAVAFLTLGDVVSGVLFQSGHFTRGDAIYVWGILAGSAVGLLASTMGRLYSSAYYALKDTRTPLRYAVLRVTLTVGLGYLFALPLPRLFGIPARWGVAGLTASAGIAGWIELLLLRRALNARIGPTGLRLARAATLYGAALVAAAGAWAVKLALATDRPLILAVPVLGTYGAAYLAATLLLGVDEARSLGARARWRR
ncbi:MAG: murein biosynthesis integral membrane protein MurJ [Acidobacteriota bacterium]